MVTRNPLDLPKTGRLLALDVGEKRVGVAVSDSARKVALSRGNWRRPWGELRQQVLLERQQNGVSAVVLGFPLNMDGSAGPMADAVQSLASLIEKELELPVLLWDERLSSRQAEAAFFEQREGRNKAGSKKESVGKMDAGAAVIVLQGVLTALA